jgi:DNA-binding SARP family transcriptional activator/tetratricopeptide (TPR) repeat protein
VQIRLLGPVDVVVDGITRPVSGLRRKSVLAVLALRHGEVVSTDRLVDVVWGEDAPSTAVNTLQSHVSHLRQVLGSRDAIRAHPPGYILDLGAAPTDVVIAERLIRQGTAATEPTEAVRHLEAALSLWRGQPLADVAGPAWLAEQADRLDQLWLQATLSLAEARLALGGHAALVPELERLARDRPFDEQIHGHLMLALYRSGRQADALAAYHRLRRSLDDELGIQPGKALRDLESAILRQDLSLQPPAPDAAPATTTTPTAGTPTTGTGDGPGSTATGPGQPQAATDATATTATTADAVAVPMQLPPAVHGFAGRDEELGALDGLLTGPEQAAGTVVISAVSGTAGIGKTTLAVCWAHRVAERFPDGQLYVNLRGFDPGGAALDPAEAVRGFLDALGVPVERIPASRDAQTALYRSLLAGRRVLVLLDNARDAEQVRPLLPAAAGCLAIVTSRNNLAPLVAAEGARPLRLDLLSGPDAEDLIARRVGADRVAAEPGAVAEIIQRCARLPLALAVVAARAANEPHFPLAALAGELREAAGSLDAFDGGDAASDVRSVLSWSYHALSPQAARLFRLLGLHPGPQTTTAAAASVAAVAVPRVRRLLAELTGARLLDERAPGRFAFHDLLRAYAAEQAELADSGPERRAALTRMFDHYLHTADAAAVLLHPYRDRVPLAPPAAGTSVPDLADRAGGAAWLTTELAALLAAVELAAAAGFDSHAWQLARNMSNFLDGRGHWRDIISSQQTALAAAARMDHSRGQADAHLALAGALWRLGQPEAAHDHLRGALELATAAGDEHGQADAHYYLALFRMGEGDHAEALRNAQRSHELYRSAGHRAGQAWALNAVGWSHGQLGDYQESLVHCTRALTIQQEIGDRSSEAETWDSMGYAHHHLGNYQQAVTCYQHALALQQHFGDRYLEADTLTHLGDAHDGAGNTASAQQAWRAALSILDSLGLPEEAAQLRLKLEHTGRPDAALRGLPATGTAYERSG